MLVNLRVAYEFGDSRQYLMSLSGDNLTGEKYCSELQDLRGVSGSYYCVPNEGRMDWSLQFRASF